MIGKKVLHYQITEKIGEGGMGVVYKAEDTKLHRQVALKFLNRNVLEASGEQERLLNEARAAAQLHHPNICTIYEINEYGGETFIAMAYVDGVTLRDRVLSSTIGLREVLEISLQIAAGLRDAHAKGIIHRDIKSANVMIDETGRAIVMDFGLARLPGQAKPDERVSSAGTSAYMSPEQARGEPIDHRADVWSLGVVLYEMLAGQMPFRGDYEQAVRYSIVNEDPRPLSEIRPSVPDEVVEIVEKCLAKNPADRYQSADELEAALKSAEETVKSPSRRQAGDRGRRSLTIRLGALAAVIVVAVLYAVFWGNRAQSEESVPIAVIDFSNETDEPALDGLSGMLITALEQSRHLSVMTRTRMFDVLKVMGREGVEAIDESLGQEICRKEGVGALVIPTIRKFGTLYTIDLKVLDTHRNKYIFTTKEEGQGQESIPRMIDKIARDIRIDLKEESDVVRETAEGVAQLTTVSLDAYKQYFEGERFLNALQFDKAAKCFNNAIELDTAFVLGHYRLAYTQWWSQHDLAAAEVHVSKAMAASDRIPEKERYLVRTLDAAIKQGFLAQIPILREMQTRYPKDKEMLFGIGDAYFHTSEYDSALVYFDKVLQLDPGFERALQHITWAYLRAGQMEKGYEAARRWVYVTGSWEAYSYLGSAAQELGKMEEAIAHYKRFSDLHKSDPQSAYASVQIAAVYLRTGRTQQAIGELERVLAASDKLPTKELVVASQALAGEVLPYLGRYHEALKMVDQGVEGMRASGDTTALMDVLAAKASLTFWAQSGQGDWKPGDIQWETMEPTFAYPDHVKSSNYWQNLAAFNMLAGRVEEGRRILTAHRVDKVVLTVFDAFARSVQGDCDRAQAIMDSLVTKRILNPESSPGVRFRIGMCHVANGSYRSAIENFDRIVDPANFNIHNAPLIPKSYYQLGRAYEALGNAELARKNYERFLDIWKNADADQREKTDAVSRLAVLRATGS